jgi:hypothetical protein
VTLHLVRAPATRPALGVEAGDWIATRTAAGWTLAPEGAPPAPAGPIDHATLARLVLAADRVLTW